MADFKHSLGFEIPSENTVNPTYKHKNGFTAGYRLPAPHFNWIVDKTTKCITEIQQTHNALESQFKSAMGMRNLHTYTSLSQIGLSGKVTMTDIFVALNKRGQCMLVLGNTNAEGSENYVSDTPTQFGTLVVTHFAAARTMAQFWKADDGHVHQYIGKYHTTEGWSGWFETFTEAHPPTPAEVGAVATETILADSVNVDGITTSGAYRLGKTPVNTPSEAYADYGQLQVIHGGKDTIAQMLFPHNTSAMYFRTGNSLAAGGKWNSWVKVANANHTHTPADIGAQALHYYYEPSQIGCTQSSSPLEIWNALPARSVFVYPGVSLTNAEWNFPNSLGTVRIEKYAEHRGMFQFFGKSKAIKDYRMYLDDATGFPECVWREDYNGASIVPIENGGTGATTAANALKNFGLTATAEELNYVDGVISNVQTQLNGKSPTTHGHALTDSGITGILPIAKGGTGASDIINARKNLNFSVQGQYKGTGNSGGGTMYNFDTGARGSNFLVIIGHSYIGWLSPKGGIMAKLSNNTAFADTTTFSAQSAHKAYYSNGYIQLHTDSVYINGEGYTYDYMCM